MEPLKIGLTGGIGSGKTTVAHFFKDLGVSVYVADVEAKQLMVTSKVLIRQLKQLFGDEVYIDQHLNKALIRSKIFNNKELLAKMNAIVHPKVERHFKRWFKKQQGTYIISESALIFENKKEANYDAIITVTAPQALRIKRVMSRDNISKETINRIITNQLDDTYKVENSQFIIVNESLKETQKQVLDCHHKILNLLKNK